MPNKPKNDLVDMRFGRLLVTGIAPKVGRYPKLLCRCGCALGDDFHRDHRVALANGGDNDITNIELLCGPCNQRKHAKDPVRWAQENGRLL